MRSSARSLLLSASAVSRAGYRFDAGHTVKLVLLGSDAPYLRKSNNAAFTVEVSDLASTLPTA